MTQVDSYLAENNIKQPVDQSGAAAEEKAGNRMVCQCLPWM